MTASLRTLSLACSLLATVALAACNSSASPFVGPSPVATPPTPVPAVQAGVRAVHGSPNAPNVDIYVYLTGQVRPTAAAVADVSFKTITPFIGLDPGSYTIDIETAGSPSTTTPLATENVTLNAGTNYSVVVAGEVGTTVQFVTFVEPVQSSTQSALTVHHASPFVGSAINPVGIGVYDAGSITGTPSAAQTLQLFSFSFTPGTSGPAASGSASGGEFFVSPIPGGLPETLGIAAGAPGTSGHSLGSDAVAAPLSAIVPGTPSIGPTSHVSLFAIDASATSATVIGAIDP